MRLYYIRLTGAGVSASTETCCANRLRDTAMSMQLANRRVQRTLCIALLAVLGFSISCDRDCPTQPPPPEDKGYNFYILLRWAGSSPYRSRVYVYNTKQMVYVDSIIFSDGFDYQDIEVSPDEKYLTLSTLSFAPHNITVLDLATSQPVLTYANTHGDVEFSPNGKYLVVQGNIPHWYLDATTFDTVATDSGAGGGGAWDSTGNIFYCLRWLNGTSYIRRFDASTLTALPDVPFIDTAYPGSPASKIQTTADPNKVFLYIFYRDGLSRLVSYNLSDSTIGFSYWFASQNTELTITTDWRTIIFTDPTNFWNYTAKRSVYFVNAQSDQLETIIPPPPVTGDLEDSNSVRVNPVQIAVSPDGKYAMTSAFEEQWQGLISVDQRKYTLFLKPSWKDGIPWGVTCSPKK
jgi:hypothetical protein